MIEYSEIFYSLQGEGRFVGQPSVFVRLFGCNLQCPGFGRGGRSDKIDYGYGKKYDKIDDVPVQTEGCDSAISWSSDFRHLSKKVDSKQISKKIVSCLPEGTFLPKEGYGQPVHLIFTGGEPLLNHHQENVCEILNHLPEVTDITFETNGTQKLSQNFIDFFNEQNSHIHVNFSISPKLTNSGEPTSKTFKPEAIASYFEIFHSFVGFKFVVFEYDQLFEVENYLSRMEDESADIISKETKFVVMPEGIWIMPEGATSDQMDEERIQKIANACLAKRYSFSPRLQIDIWNNKWGT